MKLDVLHVVPDLPTGGAERVVVQLARGTAADLRTGVVCIGRRRQTSLEASLVAAGVPWHCLGKPRGYRPWYSVALLRLVDRLQPRVLHTHRHALPYVLPVLLMRRQLRCIHTVHNPAQHEVRPALRPVHRAAFRLDVQPVAVAAAVAGSVQQLYGLRQVPVIRNGIAVERFAPDARQRDRARAALGYRPADLVLVTVGRLHPQKDPLLLLEAFARLGDRRAHLVFAGSGPLENAVERAIAARGLADRVRILSGPPGIPALLAAADVFVLASRFEGCPLAVMEAMASACPVVATAVGGVPELVQDGVTGLLVPPGSATAMTEALEVLSRDPDRRRALAAAAFAHARRHFSEAAMVRAYHRLYEQHRGAAPRLAAANA